MSSRGANGADPYTSGAAKEHHLTAHDDAFQMAMALSTVGDLIRIAAVGTL